MGIARIDLPLAVVSYPARERNDGFDGSMFATLRE